MLYHNFSLVFPGRIGYNVLQNNGWKNGKEEPDMIRRMFSLIELLITVAVIAILAGLLLPALNSARQKGQAIRCVSNLKQQGNCHSLYAADFDDWIIGEQGDYGEASNYYVYYWWRKFRLLGYTGEKLRQYEDLKGPSGQNGIFVCLSQSYVTGMDRWSYGLNGHLGGCGAGVSHTNSGESAVPLLDPGALQYQQHRARFADLQKTEKKASGSVLAAVAAASGLHGGETVITTFSPSGEPLGSFTAPLDAAAMSSCGSQLLVLFTGEESTLFSSALEEIVSYQPPEDVRQAFLCSDSRALFAGASGVVQIDFNR